MFPSLAFFLMGLSIDSLKMNIPRFRLTIEKLFSVQIGDLWFHFGTPFRFGADKDNIHPSCFLCDVRIQMRTQLMISVRSTNSFHYFLLRNSMRFSIDIIIANNQQIKWNVERNGKYVHESKGIFCHHSDSWCVMPADGMRITCKITIFDGIFFVDWFQQKYAFLIYSESIN